MKKFTRSTRIDFNPTFYAEDGGVAEPDTATLTVSYPLERWPLSGSNRETEEVDLDLVVADGSWTGSWDSSVSWPGVVFWTIVSSDPDLTTLDGNFELTGNLANLEVE